MRRKRAEEMTSIGIRFGLGGYYKTQLRYEDFNQDHETLGMKYKNRVK